MTRCLSSKGPSVHGIPAGSTRKAEGPLNLRPFVGGSSSKSFASFASSRPSLAASAPFPAGRPSSRVISKAEAATSSPGPPDTTNEAHTKGSDPDPKAAPKAEANGAPVTATPAPKSEAIPVRKQSIPARAGGAPTCSFGPALLDPAVPIVARALVAAFAILLTYGGLLTAILASSVNPLLGSVALATLLVFSTIAPQRRRFPGSAPKILAAVLGFLGIKAIGDGFTKAAVSIYSLPTYVLFIFCFTTTVVFLSPGLIKATS